jgi:hypothetical protein
MHTYTLVPATWIAFLFVMGVALIGIGASG